jgi:hypothetical protein
MLRAHKRRSPKAEIQKAGADCDGSAMTTNSLHSLRVRGSEVSVRCVVGDNVLRATFSAVSVTEPVPSASGVLERDQRRLNLRTLVS